MRVSSLLAVGVFGLGMSVAHAQAKGDAKKTTDKPMAPPAAADMAPPKAGPETSALKPFMQNFTWTGTARAGAMAPGSPEMPTKGKATCKWAMGNLWAMCDLEDTAGTGKQAMT